MAEFTETEMDEIHQTWFLSGYESGWKDARLDALSDQVAKFNREMRRLNDPVWYKPWTSNGNWYWISSVLFGLLMVAPFVVWAWLYA